MTTPTPQQQLTMTLAALASTCAAPLPSGENPVTHFVRIWEGISNYLGDPSLATGGTWAPVWLGLSPDNTNLCYIARNLAPGMNEFAVAIRGTAASLPDMLEDLDVGTVVPFTASGSPDPIAVAKGAMAAFTQIVNVRSPQTPAGGEFPDTTLLQALTTVIEEAGGASQPTVYVTGHSLGGCLASMVALYLQAQQWANPPAFAVYTFAAPTAGLDSFASYFTSVKWAAYVRTVNAYDAVPYAWADVKAIKSLFPSGTGPKATIKVGAIIDTVAGLTNGNVYVQPGPEPDTFNGDYAWHDPNLVNETLDDFMGQVAFQHANNSYLYLLGAPTIPAGPIVTGLTPTAGQPGTSVTISGSGFTPSSLVDFGPIPCPVQNVTVKSATEIIAIVPDGAGIVEVCVTTVSGTSAATQSTQFAYGGPEPVVVTSVIPSEGPSKSIKKSNVTINGSGFTSGCMVYFGDEKADLVSQSNNQLTVIPPDHSAGTVDVTVNAGVATSPTSPADEYTYKLRAGART